jgi:membrane-associated phospholipid phosphatase
MEVGVASALGIAALPHMGRSGRRLIGALIPAVGLARIYVGAHLPFDIAGGLALGFAAEAATALYQDLTEWRKPRSGSSERRLLHSAELGANSHEVGERVRQARPEGTG